MTCRSSTGAPKNLYQVRVLALFVSFVLCCAGHPSDHKGLPLIFLANISSFVLQHIGRQKHNTLVIKISKRPVNSAQWFQKRGADKDYMEVQRSASQVGIHTYVQGLSQVLELQKEQFECISAIQCEDISDCLFKMDAYSTLCPWWGISACLV